MPTFGAIDTAIVVVYLALSVGIGLVANRFITGLSGYLIAGRSLGTALSIATMTGSELGLITVMYQAQKGFTGGFAALHIGLIAGIVTLLVGLSGFIVVGLRRAEVMTIPEYYEQRFDKQTRVLGGILLALGGILNMGLFLQVGSQFVIGVTGIDGALLSIVMVGLLALVLFYTVMGGMVSVVLTDYVQFVVLSMGLIALVLMTINTLGFDSIVEVMRTHRGEASFDPSAEFGPSYIAWMGIMGLVGCAIWPTAVTRALASKSVTVVKRQFTFSAISFMIRFLLPCFLGIAAFVFITQAGATITYEFSKPKSPVAQAVASEAGLDIFEGAIPFDVRTVEDGTFEVQTLAGAQPEGADFAVLASSPFVTEADEADESGEDEAAQDLVGMAAVSYRAVDLAHIFPAGEEGPIKPAIKRFTPVDGEAQDSILALPVLFKHLLPVGLLGLLTAAMLAAFMSTHDSYLLCWSSVIARDIIAPLVPSQSSPEKQLKWTRVFIVLIGIYVLFWGLFYHPGQDVWEYLGITGAVYFTGAIVVLTAGLYWPAASRMGARLSLYAGLSAIVGLTPIKNALHLDAFSAPQIGLTTLGFAILVMIVGSLVFPDPPSPSDEQSSTAKEAL
jgi:Na+/proline symporter